MTPPLKKETNKSKKSKKNKKKTSIFLVQKIQICPNFSTKKAKVLVIDTFYGNF